VTTLTVDLSGTDHVPPGEPVREAASTLLRAVEALEDGVSGMQEDWRAVLRMYSGTDEDETLYSGFSAPCRRTDELRQVSRGLARALESLADAFDRTRRRRAEVAGPEREQAEEELRGRLQTAYGAPWPRN